MPNNMNIDRLFNKPAEIVSEAIEQLSYIKDNDIAISLAGGYGAKVRNEVCRIIRIIAPYKVDNG